MRLNLRNIIFCITFIILINIAFSGNIIYAEAKKKVVILCFDGVDGQMTKEYMEQGKLPNLAKMANEGVFSKLATTNPPQTPVSWAAFTTGWHPGKTTIFDFLKRDEGSYLPSYAQITIISNKFMLGKLNPVVFGLVAALVIFLIAYILTRLISKKKLLSLLVSLFLFVIVFAVTFLLVKNWVPIENTFVKNNRQGTPFWDVLNENGIKTNTFNIPVTFPAEGVENGKLLSGLGTPDVTGSIGKPAYFTTDPDFAPSTGEFTISFTRLDKNSDGVYYTLVTGPDRSKMVFYGENGEEEQIDIKSLGYIDEEAEMKKTPKYLFENSDQLLPDDKDKPLGIPMKLTVDEGKESVTIEIQGQKQTLKVGDWSEWYEMKFKINPILSIWAVGRFAVQQVAPHLKLYLSPIQFHPDHTLIPISYPASWSGELFQKFGMYKTVGWAVDTWSLQEELISEESFLEEAYYTRGRKEVMLYDSLENMEHDVHVQYFEYTDRIQHLFWHLFDEKHPYYKQDLAAKYNKSIEDCYIDMDRIVGEVQKRIDNNTLLFVISDHGFVSWRRAMNYNTWLRLNGFIFQDKWDDKSMELEDLFEERQENFWPNVDWSKTTAYALGIGNIYLNVAGREPNGIIKTEEEYNRIRDSIVTEMPKTIDPETGENPVVAVYKREDIWDEFDPKITPDLRVCTNRNYRVSWQSTLGNIPKELFYDVKSNWSGDHCSADPSLVDGIFFSNMKIKKSDKPKLVDFFPTILKLYGIDPNKYKPSGVNLFE